ncbi:MAG: GTP-binding protein [Alcaligenaceae bacterium]|nr:GTP-binding protein [Alcaligenaceae bacterium]
MNVNSTNKQGIGVTVVSGFLGSGKSHFIRQILNRPDAGQVAVIVNEIGEVGLDHLIYRHLSAGVAVLEGGCLCCQLNGDLSQTLRELFMLAMQKKIPAFRQVIIETSGLADPSAIAFTLNNDFFLKERFYHAGVLCVVDCCHANQQHRQNPEWLSQVLAADVVLLSKEDVCPENVDTVINLIDSVSGVKLIPKADMLQIENFFQGFEELKKQGRKKLAAFGQRWQTGQGAALKPLLKHTAVDVISFEFEQPVKRGRFMAALDAIAEKYGDALLRMKALVRFAGDDGYYHVHGVHKQRSGFEPLEVQEGEALRLCVVLVLRKGCWRDEDRVLLASVSVNTSV